MNPEQLEAVAKRAYEIFAANSGETADWNAVKPKDAWINAVRDHHLHPGAVGMSAGPNLQEQCIAQAYGEIYKPAAEKPLVIPSVFGGQSPTATDAPARHGRKTKGSKTE